MKRRNAECGKVRRPLKRNKITEGFYGSNTLLYMKYTALWGLVMMADFILEFRFEYLWPFWMLLASVYDSFKYQGLIFSAIFLCIAVTADVTCYLFIPPQWLFFLASTYVWVQYVWHMDRGICVPSATLALLFVYIEASLRLREFKSFPFNMDLCRPFAAHCIGYPVVTLGFGFKSYVSYRFRLRKQRDVEKENDFYYQLLHQSLPLELQKEIERQKALPCNEEEGISVSNLQQQVQPVSPTPPVPNGTLSHGLVNSKPDKKSRGHSADTVQETGRSGSGDSNSQMQQNAKKLNNTLVGQPPDDPELIDKSEKRASFSDIEDSDEFLENDHNSKLSNKIQNGHANPVKTTGKIKDSNSVPGKKTKSNVNSYSNKDEALARLESEVKRLKSDLQSSRSLEQELRSQLTDYTISDRTQKSELFQLRQDNESLQTKLHTLVTARQQDKQNLAALEKKLTEERKQKAAVETQLAAERKAKKAEEVATAKALAMANAARNECSDECKVRWREMEVQRGKAREDLQYKDECLMQLQKENQLLRHYKDAQNDTERLIAAFSTVQDKNLHLEASLSAENRLKQDLFSALGEAKRQIEILQGLLAKKEAEICDLKGKVAEAYSLLPSSATSHDNLMASPPYTSRYSPPVQYQYASSSPPQSPHNGGAALNCDDKGTVLNPKANDFLPKVTQ